MLVVKLACIVLTGIKLIPRTFTVIICCPESGNLYEDGTIPFGVWTKGCENSSDGL